MDFDLQAMLDGFVLDKEIGILRTTSPLGLSSEEFIDLLESGKAHDLELNQEIYGKNLSYFHTAKYKGIEFLTQTEVEISNL